VTQGPRFGVTIVGTEDRGTIYNFICADKDGNRLEFYTAAPGEAAGKTPFELRGTIDEELAHVPSDARRLASIKVGIRRTSHLTLRCRDLAKSLTFYEEALGLFPIADAHGRVYLSGDPATRRPVLALEQAIQMNVPVPTPRAMFGMEHFSMEVGSFEQLRHAFRHLKSSGAHLHHTVDHGVTNSVYCIDPAGNLIEIYHDVPRAEYRNPENPFGSFGSIEDRLEAV
jgi:catechol 2,3-dioxygenase-like lactoylglutathione lyase family enzyme